MRIKLKDDSIAPPIFFVAFGVIYLYHIETIKSFNYSF